MERDFRWLVALEAASFFSMPCWWLTASWASPLADPVGYLTAVAGPAYAARSLLRIPEWAAWVVRGFLLIWYLHWFGGALGLAWPSPVRFGLLVLPAIALAPVLRRAITVVGVLVGPAFLLSAVVTSWAGTNGLNPHYGQRPQTLYALFVPAVLVSTAPVLVASWAIGRAAPSAAAVWWSGIAGVLAPLLMLSAGFAALACEAGANLHYRPSLPVGFFWAVLSLREQVGDWVLWVEEATCLIPALRAAYSLRLLAGPLVLLRHRLLFLIATPVLSFLSLWLVLVRGGQSFFGLQGISDFHVWCSGLAIVGGSATAGLATLSQRGKARNK